MRVYNTSDSPVVVDEEGHTVAGGEWGDADAEFVGAKQALEASVLISADDAVPSSAPETATDQSGDGDHERSTPKARRRATEKEQ